VVENGRVPLPVTLPRAAVSVIAVPVIAVAVIAVTAAGALAACGSGRPPVLGDPAPTVAATQPTDAPGQLAGLAAAAQDHRFVATYTLVTKDRPNRNVLVSLAADGSWRVDLPGGALSGAADVSMVGNATGIYQCLLSGAGTNALGTAPSDAPSTDPSAPPVISYPAPACVKVAAAGGGVPKKFDPGVQHVFTDWLGVMLDRDAPIEVFPATALAHAAGACFSVEPSSASLAPPIDAGVYCFTADGAMTAASTDAGTLTLNPGTAPAPPTNSLPGPITTGPAAPIKTAVA
jgi:hypothetical protein